MAPASLNSGTDAAAANYVTEKSKAAAWAWYERGALQLMSGSTSALSTPQGRRSCSNTSTAVMVRGKYMTSRAGSSSSSRVQDSNESNGPLSLQLRASKRSLPPSRFKREADVLAHRGLVHDASDHRQEQQQPCLDDASDHQLISYNASCHAIGQLSAKEQTVDATKTISFSHHAISAAISDGLSCAPPSHYYDPLPQGSHVSPAMMHRLGDMPPHYDTPASANMNMAFRNSDASSQYDHWSDKLFGITNRNRISPLFIGHELVSLTSLFGEGCATGNLSSQNSNLLDSFELQALLRTLEPHEAGYQGSQAKDTNQHAEQPRGSDTEKANDHDHVIKEAGYQGSQAKDTNEPAEQPRGSDTEKANDHDHVIKEADDHDSMEAQHDELKESYSHKQKEAHEPASRLSKPENTSSKMVQPLIKSSDPQKSSGGPVSENIQYRSPMAENTTGNSDSDNIPGCLMAENTLVNQLRVSKSTQGTDVMVEINTMGRPSSPYNITAVASHSKQTLQDLLQWSPHSSNPTNDCSCISEDVGNRDHCYYSESPDIKYMSSDCNSTSCNTKAAQRRRRRRPSLLMAHLPQSFYNALHNLPHLPHSFSHALQHLPHSFSNALHHLPHIPQSLSNAVHHIAHLKHSLSSAYKHHVISHRHSAQASPSRDASGHAEAHSHHHTPFHLRQLFSFKMHHSPPHPDHVAFAGSTSPTIYHCSSPPASSTPVYHDKQMKVSPSRDQRLSASDDYMLIYSSAKKHSKEGAVHHHHHHHYHHYHYVV